MNVIDAEATTLDRLRDDFVAKGYKFISQPKGADLPSFLGAYRPDALAVAPNGTDRVVIEVKDSATRKSRVPVSEMDQDAASKNGWRYLLVYAGQDPSDIVELSRSQKFQVDDAIREVHELEKSGYLRAAVLEGWSLLEALARRIYPDDIRVALKPLSPTTVIERLAMDGQVSEPDARRLRKLISIRNAVAHGDLSVNVSKDDLRFLLEQIEVVNSRVDA